MYAFFTISSSRLTERLFDDGESRGWAGEQPRVNIKPFQEWVRRCHEHSLLLTWLVRSPLETFIRPPNEAAEHGSRRAPSGVHFDAIEIDSLHDLYTRVRQSSSSGRVDQPAFESLFCPPLSVELARGLFAAFDEHGIIGCPDQQLNNGLSAPPTLERPHVKMPCACSSDGRGRVACGAVHELDLI